MSHTDTPHRISRKIQIKEWNSYMRSGQIQRTRKNTGKCSDAPTKLTVADIETKTNISGLITQRNVCVFYIYQKMPTSSPPQKKAWAALLLGLRARIRPGAWMSVCCECCVLSGRGLCVGLIPRPEESYRL
jgi:hypothetical protein